MCACEEYSSATYAFCGPPGAALSLNSCCTCGAITRVVLQVAATQDSQGILLLDSGHTRHTRRALCSHSRLRWVGLCSLPGPVHAHLQRNPVSSFNPCCTFHATTHALSLLVYSRDVACLFLLPSALHVCLGPTYSAA
jgi:hypothetical protein